MEFHRLRLSRVPVIDDSVIRSHLRKKASGLWRQVSVLVMLFSSCQGVLQSTVPPRALVASTHRPSLSKSFWSAPP